jgi:hypothetical protein
MATLHIAAILGEEAERFERVREFQIRLLGLDTITAQRWQEEENALLELLAEQEQYQRLTAYLIENPATIRRILAVWFDLE